MIPHGYDLISEISSTQSAQVWRTRNAVGAPVALKLAANDSRVERRFKREIEAMQLSAGHHVMPLLDFDETYSWYVMPLAAGTLYSLEHKLPTSFEASLRVLEAITVALQPLHDAQQVHRDLKPQNILWLEDKGDRRWVVADFGIVRNPAGLTTDQLTQAGGLTGSQGWAAPEQHDDAHTATCEADVYAAAAIMSWMLTGKKPTYGHVKYPVAPPLSAVLRQATASRPMNRYPNLNDFLDAVKNTAVASTAKLEDLVAKNDWLTVSSYVGQANRRNQVLTTLPKLTQAQVDNWFKADRPGLVRSVSDALNNLRADYSELNMQSQVDPFLSWAVRVLRVLINNNKLEDATDVATALFNVTAVIHQFGPAKDMLDLLDGLNKQAQEAMENALHSSNDTLRFFKMMANDRWSSKSKSELVQRLQE